jgi:HEAT repeat protein
MNKHRLFIILSFLFVIVRSFGQTGSGDIRTTETKIADLLAQMPAENQDHLNSLMNSMADLGEDGLFQMAGMLTSSDRGNDASVRFAMGGFSKFVTGAGQENKRQLCVRAWCRALEAAGDPGIKSFIIAQIQQAGDAMAVPFLEKYLRDESLSDPAARALVTIGTPEAGQVLLNALGNTKGIARISIVEALGDLGFSAAISGIMPLCSETDIQLKKASLYALAQFGSPQSASLLYDAALKSGFTFEPTLATSSYLLWIDRLIAGGNKTIAAKHCIDLIGQCTLESQTHTRSASLSLLVSASGSKAAKYLFDAFKSGNRQYWMSALQLSDQIKTSEHTQGWLKTAAKLSGQPKSDIIQMLGQRGDAAALPFVRESLDDTDEIVRMASVVALVKLKHEDALMLLITMLKKGNIAEIAVIQTQLLSLGGDAMIPAIAAAIPEMPASAKMALIEVLAARKSTTHLSLVYKEAASTDADVRLVALKALNSLVNEKDLDQLIPLISQAKTPEDVAAIQTAIITAVKSLPAEKQTGVIIPVFMSKSGAEKKALYGVLAGVGHSESLKAVVGDFNSANTDLKPAAFEALTNWSDPGAITSLYDIGILPENNAYREPAFNACIKMIHQSGFTDDQKLLLLRKVTDLAGSDKDKLIVLDEVADYRTYPALKFASGFLDIPSLQSEAARAISSIALSAKLLYGEDIKALLEKCITLLTGPEAEYEKEAIRKHIAAMPAGDGFVPLFNGKDLTGWKGLVENPSSRSKMKRGQ